MTEDNKELIGVLKDINEKLGDIRYDLKREKIAFSFHDTTSVLA